MLKKKIKLGPFIKFVKYFMFTEIGQEAIELELMQLFRDSLYVYPTCRVLRWLWKISNINALRKQDKSRICL